MAPPRYDRNVEAQALGFRNYYEVRLRGGLAAARRGDITPDTPRPEGVELTRARGHRADYLAQILRNIDPGSLIMIGSNLGDLDRNEMGNWDEIPVSAYSGEHDEFDFVLYDISDEELEWFISELDYLDVDYSPDYDLNALVPS